MQLVDTIRLFLIIIFPIKFLDNFSCFAVLKKANFSAEYLFHTALPSSFGNDTERDLQEVDGLSARERELGERGASLPL